MENTHYMLDFIDETCHELLDEKTKRGLAVEGIILTGSHVHGMTHKHSDIDLFVIVQEKKEFIRHEIFKRKGKIIQVRECSYEKFAKECLVHERKRPASFACKILYDRKGLCKNVIKQSDMFMCLGPKKLSAEERTKLQSVIKNEIDTIQGLICSNKSIAANLLINELVCMNVSYYNNENGYWMSNHNYLFEELKEHNCEIYTLVEEIVQESQIHIKFEKLKQLCTLVIKNFNDITGEYMYDEYF